ncbi:MAG: acyl-CoA dehydrogenase family protein [Chloroflexi bacterium]|nr:acyl-CoA dehydrogenase family protein [Chloroflexota bacterium]
MDYRFTPEEEAFRTEVQAFLKAEIPADWDFDPFELREDTWDFAHSFTRKLAAKGWIAPAWPREYGGQDFPFMKQVVLSEELAYYRAPNTAIIGVNYAGPTLIVYGTEEQKKELIPGILSGDIIWCQGYSEPNAGSDLASLEMRAVKDGDDYVLNGTKTWSSNAHKANWCFLMARTDQDAPKHKGISYFVTPMDTPGITVRPLINMANEHIFNEIIFEDVRVPARYLVGEENRGWYIGMTTLDFERSNISSAASYRRSLDTLVKYVKETGDRGQETGNGPSAPRLHRGLRTCLVTGDDGEAGGDATVRDGDSGVGWHRNGGGDAGYDLKRDAGGMQRLGFLAAAAKDERVAALQPDDTPAPPRPVD